MRQRKRTSLIEAIANTLIGYGVALVAQWVVFPLFDIHITLTENLVIGGIFMGISTIRSYALRRAFEWLRVNKVMA